MIVSLTQYQRNALEKMARDRFYGGNTNRTGEALERQGLAHFVYGPTGTYWDGKWELTAAGKAALDA
jgi:hypothetical protein